jgi:hypothetical protein
MAQAVEELLTSGQLKLDAITRAYTALKVEVRAANAIVSDDIRVGVEDAGALWVTTHSEALKLQQAAIGKPNGDSIQEGKS